MHIKSLYRGSHLFYGLCVETRMRFVKLQVTAHSQKRGCTVMVTWHCHQRSNPIRAYFVLPEQTFAITSISSRLCPCGGFWAELVVCLPGQ